MKKQLSKNPKAVAARNRRARQKDPWGEDTKHYVNDDLLGQAPAMSEEARFFVQQVAENAHQRGHEVGFDQGRRQLKDFVAAEQPTQRTHEGACLGFSPRAVLKAGGFKLKIKAQQLDLEVEEG